MERVPLSAWPKKLPSSYHEHTTFWRGPGTGGPLEKGESQRQLGRSSRNDAISWGQGTREEKASRSAKNNLLDSAKSPASVLGLTGKPARSRSRMQGGLKSKTRGGGKWEILVRSAPHWKNSPRCQRYMRNVDKISYERKSHLLTKM